MSEDEINQLPELDPIFNDNTLTKPNSYPRMRKRTKSIVKYIERQLGGDVLELELTPVQIKEIVDEAFDELKHYISDTYTVTVPFAKCIDLKKYNIDADNQPNYTMPLAHLFRSSHAPFFLPNGKPGIRSRSEGFKRRDRHRVECFF